MPPESCLARLRVPVEPAEGRARGAAWPATRKPGGTPEAPADWKVPVHGGRCQCHLLCVSRSSLYHRPKGESAENLALMRRIDELFLKYPFQSELVRQSREGEGIGRARADRRRCCIQTACDMLTVIATDERKQRNFKGLGVSCPLVSRTALISERNQLRPGTLPPGAILLQRQRPKLSRAVPRIESRHLQSALLEAFEQPEVRAAGAAVFIGVEILPLSAYERIVELERLAAAQGYPELR